MGAASCAMALSVLKRTWTSYDSQRARASEDVSSKLFLHDIVSQTTKPKKTSQARLENPIRTTATALRTLCRNPRDHPLPVAPGPIACLPSSLQSRKAVNEYLGRRLQPSHRRLSFQLGVIATTLLSQKRCLTVGLFIVRSSGIYLPFQ